jgi:XTP/dITP diphosphohydrolase
VSALDKPLRELFLATSNPGKIDEFRALAQSGASGAGAIEIAPVPNFASLPQFSEDAPTFAENAAGKTLHYSRFCEACVLADDSGLVVPALGGAPGVHSARYAGPNATSEQRMNKLLAALQRETGTGRDAYFACVLSVAWQGRVFAVVSAAVHGKILEGSRGMGGFGYDPIFYLPDLGKTFAELSRDEKNQYSHRGKAFRRLLNALR